METNSDLFVARPRSRFFRKAFVTAPPARAEYDKRSSKGKPVFIVSELNQAISENLKFDRAALLAKLARESEASKHLAQLNAAVKEAAQIKKRERAKALKAKIRAVRKANESADALVRRRKRDYNMDSTQVKLLLASQDFRCAACGDESPGRQWHIDHDHECCKTKRLCGKCIRGILCHRCNLALGLAQDNRWRLLGMVAYLDRWNSKKQLANS